MTEMFNRAFENLMARDSGPFHLRLFLQPLMATILAIRAGWPDAWQGRPIFFWTLLREPTRTATMARNLWRIVGKVFLVAVVLDLVYQFIVLRWVYPLETLIVATALALVPCMIVRGIGNRIVTFIRLKQLHDEERTSLDGSIGMSNNVEVSDSPRSAVGQGKTTKEI